MVPLSSPGRARVNAFGPLSRLRTGDPYRFRREADRVLSRMPPVQYEAGRSRSDRNGRQW